MAALAIGLAAGTAATAAGGATLAPLAVSIGIMAGNAIFGSSSSSSSTEGSRLEDTKVSISSYGSVIPQIFGTFRTSANMIWSTNIKETKHKKKVGGKGGFGKTTQKTYTYSISFAHLLCDNEILAVRKIFSNGEVVYDASETNASVTTSLRTNSMKVYKGTEDQMPDPTIEAYEGAGNVEPYRGCAYIVFDNLQLEDFGNAVPNFTYEIVGLDGKISYVLTTFEKIESVNSGVYYDEENQKIVRVQSGNNNDNTFYITDLYSDNTIIKTMPLVNFSSIGARNIRKVSTKVMLTAFNEGALILDNNFNYVTSLYLSHFDNYISYAYIDSVAFNEYDQNAYTIGFNSNTITIGKVISLETTVAVRNTLSYINVSEFNFKQKGNFSFSTENCIANKNNGVLINNNKMYFYYNYDSLVEIYEIDLFMNSIRKIKTLDNADANHYGNVFYIDDVSNNIIICLSDKRYNQQSSFCSKINLSNFAEERFYIKDVLSDFLFVTDCDFSIDENRNILFHANGIGDTTIYLITINIDNFSDYVISYDDVQTTSYGFGYQFTYYDSEQQAIFNVQNNPNQIVKMILNRVSKSDVYAENIIRELTIKAGLELTDIDTTEISDYELHGYGITSDSQLRASVEQIQVPLNFQVVESGYKLKYISNNRNISKVIDIKELGAQNYSSGAMSFNDDFTTTRKNESQMSKTINLTYMDLDDNYNQNTQQIIDQNVKSTATTSVDLAIALTADEARALAQRVLYDSYIQRQTYTFSTNYDHIDLEPGDVIQINDDTRKYVMKITKKDSDGGIIKFEASAYNSYTYDQYAVGASSPQQQTKLQVISRTDSFLMDIPLLTNNDFIGFYASSSPTAKTLKWNGSTLYNSSDNADFNEKESFDTSVTNGYSINKLGDFKEGNVFDSYNTVTVVVNEELESITQEQVLNGKNLALLGNELIQFMNAELIATNTYKLSGLLRGRYATESYINTHINSEQFVLLEVDTVQSIVNTTSSINLQMYYKNVSFGRTLNDTSAISFTNTARNQYIPSVENVQSSRNNTGDLNFTWIPRLRGMNFLQDYSIPNDIDASLYDIEILSSAGTVLRTISGLTNTSYTYTSSMQVTDFGSAQSNIRVNIYKINSVIGRGAVRSVTL